MLITAFDKGVASGKIRVWGKGSTGDRPMATLTEYADVPVTDALPPAEEEMQPPVAYRQKDWNEIARQAETDSAPKGSSACNML
jgi:hypothetical protein